MLTSRQEEVLFSIVRLYNKYKEPIGSNTLLKETVLDVSPATIRNDMVILEGAGLLNKTHTSSGRVPSLQAYEYYIDELLNRENTHNIPLSNYDAKSMDALQKLLQYSPQQRAKLAADIIVSLTNFTVVVLDQERLTHYIQDFKFFRLSDRDYLVTLVTSQGRIESDIMHLDFELNAEDEVRINELVSREIVNLSLDEAYQRSRLSIPLLTQRIIGYQIDLTPVVKKALDHAKVHQFYVSGKHNIFDLLSTHNNKNAFKQMLELVDGSNDMIELLENSSYQIEVLFGHNFLNEGSDISFVRGAYHTDKQHISLGLFGPTTMSYERVIAMMANVLDILAK